MQVSRRGDVDPFIVMDIMHMAAEAEAEGRHVIHMEVGQPGTPAPSTARKALAKLDGSQQNKRRSMRWMASRSAAVRLS